MAVRLFLALLLILVGSGCTSWSAERPALGGTLTIRLKAEIPLVNPLVDELSAQRALRLIFSGLTRLNAAFEVEPDLAKRWETSPNGLIWTFQLRKNLQWHDGTPLTVEDVAYTYRYLMQGDPISIVEADLQQVVEDVAIVDEETVRFTLRRAFAPFLADTAVPILPKHIWPGLAEARKATVSIGSGPFKLAEHRSGQALILEPNHSYYGGRPYVDRLAIVFTPEEAALQAVNSGQLTVAEVDFDSLPRVAMDYSLHAYTEVGYNYVGFNVRGDRLFADKRLRLAWGKAVDKQRLVAEATGGKAQPIWGPVPTSNWAYDAVVSPVARDPEGARKLLAEAGWRDTNGDGTLEKDGRSLSVELFVRADARDRVLAAQMMASQLREVGFDVKVSAADFSTVMAAKRKPPFDFDAIVMGWDLGIDPDSYYLFASGQIPSEEKPELLNYGGFKNAEYDRLAIEARTTFDYGKRKALYAKIQALLAEELPYYFLWSERTYVAASPGLKGPINLNSPLFLWNVEKWHF